MSKKHIPRRNGVGIRQVLIPGKRKARPHPWAAAIQEILAEKR